MIVMGSVDFRTASGGKSVLLYFSLKVADIDLNSSLPLFRPVRLYKSPSTCKLHGTKLSYTRCREMFKSCLKALSLDADKLYGQAPSVVINSSNLSERLLNLRDPLGSRTVQNIFFQEGTVTNPAI